MTQKPLTDPGWRILRAETLHENKWLRLRKYETIAPTGAPADYTILEMHNLAIGVLPVDEAGFVTLIGQSRFASGRYSWELPEGGGNKNRPPLEAAQRELAEEAGLSADHWQLILSCDLSNSITDERAFCYLATGLQPCHGEPDDVELLARRTLHFRDLLEEVTSGHIRDSLTMMMVLRLYQMATDAHLDPGLCRALLTRPLPSAAAGAQYE